MNLLDEQPMHTNQLTLAAAASQSAQPKDLTDRDTDPSLAALALIELELRRAHRSATNVRALEACADLRELLRGRERLETDPATNPAQDPLFLLQCGAVDSNGEQDDWEIEADSGARVGQFCALNPGKTVSLYPLESGAGSGQVPDFRHPKIQSILRANARLGLQLGIVEDLVEHGPGAQFEPSALEHWTPLHDRLRTALTPQSGGLQPWREQVSATLNAAHEVTGWLDLDVWRQHAALEKDVQRLAAAAARCRITLKSV